MNFNLKKITGGEIMKYLYSYLPFLLVLGFMFFMMRRGGGCCGGGHDHSRHTNKNPNNLNESDKKNPNT